MVDISKNVKDNLESEELNSNIEKQEINIVEDSIQGNTLENSLEDNNILNNKQDHEDANADIVNCLALTVQKDYSLAIAKNVVIKALKSTWKIVLSIFTLNFLKFFL